MQNAAEWVDGLPVYDYPGLVNTPQRGDTLAETLGTGSAALLRGHGDVVVGRDVTATVMKSVALKDNATVLNQVLAHGQPRYWTREEAQAWSEPMHQHLSREAAAALAGRVWDYYKARVDGRLAALLNGEGS